MENENMEKIILNDEELKEVTGGASQGYDSLELEKCGRYQSRVFCMQQPSMCAWIDNQCKFNPKIFK
jgi:bacteriocin-like protein